MINILLIASIFGFVLSTLLFLKRSSTHIKATIFLGSFYLLLSIYALQTYIVEAKYLDNFTWFFIWPLIPYNAIVIPIYYYFESIFRDQLQWKKRDLLVFVPLFLALIDAAYVYLQPDAVYAEILKKAIINPEDRLEAEYWLLGLDHHVLMRHLWQLGVLLVLLPRLKHFVKLGGEDRLKKTLNKWLSLFWGILLAFALSAILYVFEKMTGIRLLYSLLNKEQGGIVTLILYLSFLFIGIFPIYFPSILHGYPQAKRPQHFKRKGQNESELKFGLAEQETTTKLELLKQKKLYLDQSFNLTKCAQEMQMPAHHISYFLKSHYGLTFTAYKNKLRMDYAIRLIEEGFLENSTIEALAGECGFASRTSFSKAFKNATEVSPSQYASVIK